MEGPAVRSPRMGGVLDGFWPTPYPGCPAGMRADPHTAPSLIYPCLYILAADWHSGTGALLAVPTDE